MSAPPVSVLLPCRDAAATLEASLRSLSAQRWSGFEVVAVDDGSRDGTGELLERWGDRDDRLRVLRTERRGLVPALNDAARVARGRLLARMDADDVAHPERLGSQVAFMEERPELAACGTGVRYVPREEIGSGLLRYERWLNGVRTADEVRRDLFVECPVAHPTLMIRAPALEELGGYRRRGWPEDYDLILRLHAAGMRAANVGRTLLHWRRGEDRLSRTSPRYERDAFRRCRVHFLLEGPLPSDRPVVVWGAGSVGKRFGRELREQGGEMRAWVDVDPRKIGQEIHGLPVLSPRELAVDAARAAEPDGPGPSPYVLVAVGAPGARDEIREELRDIGLRELRDFRAVA